MTWETCIVNLNSDSTGSFYSGDIVTGTIVLELRQQQKIERIDLEVIGICKAQWSRPMPTIPYIKIYSEKKKVLSIQFIDIFRGIFSGTKILPGVYSHPFHFALPNDIPSTFESSIAKVHYCVKISSKPTSKIKKVVPFVVQGNVNLNHIEEKLMYSFHEFHRTFRNSARFFISIKTYTAFASKQSIPFEVTINNDKNVKIHKLNISLIQKLNYNITAGHCDEEKKNYKIDHKNFSNTTAEMCNLTMKVPQLTPSSIHVLKPMINISYVFRVEVIFPFHFTLREDIPVTVATVPVIHHEF